MPTRADLAAVDSNYAELELEARRDPGFSHTLPLSGTIWASMVGTTISHCRITEKLGESSYVCWIRTN